MILIKKQQIYAICGISAPVIFTLLVIIASLMRSDYSQTQNYVSDLGVGPFAFIQNINFVLFGILTIVMALGLRLSLTDVKNRSTKAGVVFVVLFGLGVMFAGVFPENYLNQVPHNLVSSAAFVSIIAAQLFIWNGLRHEDKTTWGRYPTYSLVSGLLSLILVILLKVAMIYFVDYQGAFQRLFLAVPWIWIGITGLKLYYLEK
jgi:hypothetical membrane protein